MAEPWAARDEGFSGFLDVALAFIYPVIPWELFCALPWVLAYLASRALRDPTVKYATMSQLVPCPTC